MKKHVHAKEEPRFEHTNRYESKLKLDYHKMLGEMLGEITVALTKRLKNDPEPKPDRGNT